MVFVPAMLIGAFTLVACGNDDDGGGGSASDEEYMRSLCSATADFANDFSELDAETEEEMLDGATGVFRDFVDDMRNIGTPDDVREYHERFTEQLDQIVNELEDGNTEALFSFDADWEFPDEIQERLSTVAEDIDECQEVGAF